MEWLWPALALVLIIEGVGPLLFPRRWRAYLFHLSQQPSNSLRRMGGILVVIGVIAFYYAS
ncbi:DUF2065 family protein [Alteromonas sp. 345S023]|uniref:DUF2065 family protein n=1 Tax=Alteromonas profundi TaxID=2696062 RepID=A0A7X5RMK6_9ALTE|nr:DUF2065 domain-containing protein [Alteromonas profundi]NDV92836.1 DUF2065 family protein [Alteromonas profundi]